MQEKRCEAIYTHREWPLHGQCTAKATKQKIEYGELVYSCDIHAAANPWYKWEDIQKEI